MTEKWSYRKLTSEMRKVGWQSAGQGSYHYTHKNGRIVQINLFALDTVAKREIWHRYAEANETPAPF